MSKQSILKNKSQFSYKKELVGLMLIALSLFLVLSLVSYSPSDYSLFHFDTESREIRNLCGILGANAAAMLVFFLGSASFIALFTLFFIGVTFFSKRSIWDELIRTSSLIFLLFASASLFYLYRIDFTSSYPGGLVGYEISIALQKFLGISGIYIFLYSIILLTLMFLLEFSVFSYLMRLVSLFNAALYPVIRALKTIRLPNFIFKKKQVESVQPATVAPQHIFAKTDIEPVTSSQPVINNQEQDSSLPDPSIFETTSKKNPLVQSEELKDQAKRLEEKLSYFGLKGKVTSIHPGPVITLYEYAPDIDTKISKIVALEDDLALALKALSIRIVAPIPGKSVVGFEIANHTREAVSFYNIVSLETFQKTDMVLPLILGVDTSGAPVIEDLVNMPHLLVAGSTGSGKSVGLNVMLISLLCKLTPKDLKLVLIDPKRLEFSSYKDIPHLIFPIITNPRKVAAILKWVVKEMERRYELMAEAGVRNLLEYQGLCTKKPDLEKLSFIVVVVDEFADLMMVAGKEIELHIARIAQMARAAGIHMIIATQRPSVDVITGIIKVNFPFRISFKVSSRIDSKTILDEPGSEKLLGKGDMLCTSSRHGLRRVHGAYISDKEIQKLCDYLRSKSVATYLDVDEVEAQVARMDNEQQSDELFPQILEYVKTQEEVSISMIQRKYQIGFNRSARIIEMLEYSGIVAPAVGSKPRKVLR